MKKRLSILFCVMLPMACLAQSMAPVDIPSPNASDLGRFGDIPVSYYTGRPDISIPLYELECKGVKMPIKLQYEPSGVLMNSLPGWTGHNWTLMAGGAITRVQQGRPDEFRLPEQHGQHTWFDSYIHTYSRLLRLNKNTPLKNIPDSIYDGTYDLEPDIFMFNMMGINGRFFLGNDGQWKVCCDNNVEVLLDIEDSDNYMDPFFKDYPFAEVNYTQPKTIKGFTLVREDGIKYIFGNDKDAIEYSTSLFRSSDREHTESWTANAWYLTRVEDRYGNVLFKLAYDRGSFIVCLYNIYEQMYYNGKCYMGSLLTTTMRFGTTFFTSNSSFPYSGKIITPVYLCRIESSPGANPTGMRLEFNSSDIIDTSTNSNNIGMEKYYPNHPTADELTSENLFMNWDEWNNLPYTDKLSHAGKVFYDDYQYYYLQSNDNSVVKWQNSARKTDLEKYRNPLRQGCLRRLEQILSFPRGASQGKCYVFNYDSNSRMHLASIWIGNSDDADCLSETKHDGEYKFVYNNFSSLPTDYLTEQVDAWGYYGTYNTISPTFTQYGMLTDIVYPTGGVSSFVYEQNSYGTYMSDNRQTAITETGLAGGLRIKMITEYDDASKMKILSRRTFNYNNPYTGACSGELFAKPRFTWSEWHPQALNQDINYPTIVTVSYSRRSSLIPLSNMFGPHIGYSFVTETFMDGSKNVYNYYNISDAKDARFEMTFPTNADPSPFDRYSERGYKRGKLKSVSYYEADGSLTKRIAHQYRTDDVEQNYVLCSNFSCANYDGSASFYFVFGGLYKLFYPKYDVVSDTITYPGKTEIVSYQRQDYHPVIGNAQTDIRLLLSKTLCRNGNTFKTTYQYPVTMASGTIEHDHLLPQFFHQPVQSKEYLNGHEVSSHTTKYMQQYGLILPQYELESKYGSTPDTLITYLNYSNKGTLLQYRERGMPVTTLQWEGNDNYLKSKTVGTHVTSYTYDDAWNLSSITQPNGDKQYFNYDGLGRLIEILDRNQKVLKRFQYHYKTEQQ